MSEVAEHSWTHGGGGAGRGGLEPPPADGEGPGKAPGPGLLGWPLGHASWLPACPLPASCLPACLTD